MAVTYATQTMGIEEFLSLPEREERLELVHGEIVVSPRARTTHQMLLGHLYHLFYVRVGRSGVLVPDKEMIVETARGEENVRCPDLCYVRESRRNIVSEDAIQEAADLAVEILSEGTEEVDRITKREEFRESGVKEYWIVDIPERAVLIHYFERDQTQLYQRADQIESKLLAALGLPATFSVEEIFSIFG